MPRRHSFPKQTPLTKRVADDFELNNLRSAIAFRKCYLEERYAMDDNLLKSEIARKVLLQDAHKIDFLQEEVERSATGSEAAVAKVAEERQCKPDQTHFTSCSLRTSYSTQIRSSPRHPLIIQSHFLQRYQRVSTFSF